MSKPCYPEEEMIQNLPSLTAHKVAMMRAAHQLLDHPKVFEDTVALSIVGEQGVAEIHANKQKFKSRLQMYLRAIVVARSRFAEDELAATVKQGIRQYVILGAGLDTFAYRNPYTAEGLKVFEVDYPATQKWKRQQLKAAGISVTETVIYAPVDFETQALGRQLQKAGFRRDIPAFISWLGVTMYLEREVIMATMKEIFLLADSGSRIVFDYRAQPASQSLLHRLAHKIIERRLSGMGEPFKSYFDPDELIMDLKAIGFEFAEDIGPEEINAQFFNDRTDNLMVGSSGHLMKTQV